MYKLLETYFWYKLKPSKINKYLKKERRLIAAGDKRSELPKVACVQRSIKPAGSIEDYIDMIDGFAAEAYRNGCDLLIFPEYNFFDLLGIIPGFRAIDKLLNKSAIKSSKKADGNSSNKSMYQLFFAIADPIHRAMEQIMCSVASKYGIIIYTGTYLIKEGNKLYNAGALISREGAVLGHQKKINLTDFESKLGFGRVSELKAFDTDIGRLAVPVCMDATYYETFKRAAALGCDIVVLPIANNEEYNVYRAMRGIWARVQESYVIGAKAALTGWIAGMHFTGKAGIFAPIAMSDKGDGIIAISMESEGDELAMAELDISKLKRHREEAEYYGDANEIFELSYHIVQGKQ